MRIRALLLLLTMAVAVPCCCQDLLPTAPTAQLVRHLLQSWPGVATDPNAVAKQRARGRQVREQVSRFIVRQLDAKPSISPRELETQLRKIFGRDSWNNCRDCDEPPHVWCDDDWGSRTTQRRYIIAYDLALGFIGGSLATIDSYRWADGKTRLEARGGSELDGHAAHFQEVSWHADTGEYWVLAWGTVEGASGRGLRGKALVYHVNAEGVRPIWQTANDVDNVTAQRSEIGWEVAYADNHLLYANDPRPYFFDVYKFDWVKKSFERVVHYRYAQE